MAMLEIDGSFGEGGGQILRSALSLSCYLLKPFRIFNIRVRRKNPGLKPQHLTCVRVAQLISGAEVKGDSVGSLELSFIPYKVLGGHYKIDIGTAGSTSLVFQTVLLPLCFADNKSEITISGGTHVPWSPPFHYLKQVFLPLLERVGVNVNLDIERWGFYPRGGGIIKAFIKPAGSIRPINIEQKGVLKILKGISAVCNLPLNIAERQKTSALEILKNYGLLSTSLQQSDIEVLSAPCIGQGTFFFLSGEFENSLAGFSSLGERSKRAEDVGREAAEEFVRFYSGTGALDRRLADQIVPYLALSNKTSLLTTEITQHLLTNIWVIQKFLDVKIEVEGEEGETGRMIINS